jgi:hypothetical protein
MGWFWWSLYGIYVILWACVAILMLKSNLMSSLAYNFNPVNSVLIINESSVGAFLLKALHLISPCYYPLHIILFLHLLSTNHKCTQPCYFPLLLKPAALKEMMDWNALTRSSRLRVAPGWLFLWCYGVFCCSVSLRVILVFKDIIYVIIILYIMTFGYLWALLAVCVEQLILGHAYDEYSILA